MSLSAFIEQLLRLALLLGGLIVPGSMLLRALRLPWSLAAAFGLSSAVLYLSVLALGLTGAGVSLPALCAALALVSLGARLVPASCRESACSSFACFTRLGGWMPLYALFWVVVAWRLATQPLTGPDVYFRWSWLAEQILHHGTLDFYPPQSGEDFIRYFWAESIPPGIASLYTWAYACGGGTHALWTSPVVAVQLLALHELAWRIGNRWGGETVARRAVVLVAASPLLAWSALIGQETGLTAVAVCGLVWAFARLREEHGDNWAVLAGAFGTVAASTREYGIAFAVVAAAVASAAGASKRRLSLLVLASLPAVVWPVLVWYRTGNPFFSLDLAGLFPVNARFIAWAAVFHAPHLHPLATAAEWLGLGRYFLLWALPAVGGFVVLLAAALRGLREARTIAVFVGLTIGLWWLSLPYTAGGLFYSLRVLSPALALLAILAAYGSVAYLPAIGLRAVAVLLALVLAESLPKTLVLPQNPYRLTLDAWAHAGRAFTDSVRASERAMLTAFQSLPPSRRIITDNASYARVFATIGVEVLPIWSPDIAWLFDEKLPADELAHRWRQSGLRYLVLGKSPSGIDFVLKRAQWRAPYFTVRMAAESGNDVILEVVANTH